MGPRYCRGYLETSNECVRYWQTSEDNLRCLFLFCFVCLFVEDICLLVFLFVCLFVAFLLLLDTGRQLRINQGDSADCNVGFPDDALAFYLGESFFAPWILQHLTFGILKSNSQEEVWFNIKKVNKHTCAQIMNYKRVWENLGGLLLGRRDPIITLARDAPPRGGQNTSTNTKIGNLKMQPIWWFF